MPRRATAHLAICYRARGAPAGWDETLWVGTFRCARQVPRARSANRRLLTIHLPVAFDAGKRVMQRAGREMALPRLPRGGTVPRRSRHGPHIQGCRHCRPLRAQPNFVRQSWRASILRSRPTSSWSCLPGHRLTVCLRSNDAVDVADRCSTVPGITVPEVWTDPVYVTLGKGAVTTDTPRNDRGSLGQRLTTRTSAWAEIRFPWFEP